MKEQKYTSANTSINAEKLPTAFKKILPKGHICDFGSGKFTQHIKNYCIMQGAKSYNPIDPYNQPNEINHKTINMGRCHGFDTIYCCNVLNVINDDDTIRNIIEICYCWLKSNGKLIVQIYEGDKTGKGKETKKDCYQRNEKTSEYLRFFSFLNEIVKIQTKGNIIIIENTTPFDPPYILR